MANWIYYINTATAAQDNKSFINKRVFKIKACEVSLIANNLDELWSANLCSQDEAYCQPWVPGDKIYFQYTNDRATAVSALYQLINKESGQIITTPGAVTVENGVDANGTTYLNVIIDTTNIEECCFYLRITLFNCTVDAGMLTTCIDAQLALGVSYTEAYYACMVDLCNESNITQIFSEPFCKVTCESTLVIEGTYTKYDCDGNYYAAFDDDYNPVNSFKQKIRVFGELTRENYNITETLVSNDRTGTKMKSAFRLMTPKIPPYVVAQLANCFNAEHLYIDGVEYKNGVTLEKNNDVGNMWIINTTVARICDEINFLCE